VKEKCINFWFENPKERDFLEDMGIDGKILLKWSIDIGCEGMDHIHLA
jgi:hypothetical protein